MAKKKIDNISDIKISGLDKDAKVITRFPPEPSAYLHLGHAKAVILNRQIADNYNGKMILRFDDTNPATSREEFVNAIKQDLTMLEIKWDSISFASDHFDRLLSDAKRLITDGKAYVDSSTKEDISEQRRGKIGKASPCRDQSVEDNLKLWSNMLSLTPAARYVLRAKIDSNHINKSMRDPVLYRRAKGGVEHYKIMYILLMISSALCLIYTCSSDTRVPR